MPTQRELQTIFEVGIFRVQLPDLPDLGRRDILANALTTGFTGSSSSSSESSSLRGRLGGSLRGGSTAGAGAVTKEGGLERGVGN